VPALFGMSFTALGAAQSAAGMGYLDGSGALSQGLASSFAFVDDSLARVIRELKEKHLYDSTWIFVTAAYGQSPIDPRKRRTILLDRVAATANSVRPGLVAHVSGGDVAMVWISDPSTTPAVAKAYDQRAAALGIEEVYSGSRLALTLNPPGLHAGQDPRMPDIILQPELGVRWTTPNDTTVASYGGQLDQDTHVALLVSGAQLTGRRDPTWVPTTQIAPLLLRALGMEKFDLQALHQEHTPALPGIF
jgi:arylsulfatase A-like enzyme